jgi:hypothetical protein
MKHNVLQISPEVEQDGGGQHRKPLRDRNVIEQAPMPSLRGQRQAKRRRRERDSQQDRVSAGIAKLLGQRRSLEAIASAGAAASHSATTAKTPMKAASRVAVSLVGMVRPARTVDLGKTWLAPKAIPILKATRP